MIEGVRCDVLSCSQSTIYCKVGKAPLVRPTPFASTTGLTMKYWWAVPVNIAYMYTAKAFTDFNLYPKFPSSISTTLNGLQGIKQDFADFYHLQVTIPILLNLSSAHSILLYKFSSSIAFLSRLLSIYNNDNNCNNSIYSTFLF